MLINGSDLMSYVKLDGSDKFVSCGGATSHTLNLQLDLQDFATKDAVGGSRNGRWTMKYPGLLSWSISSDNYVCDLSSIGDEDSFSDNKLAGIGFDQLFDAFVNRKPILVAFGLEGNSKSLVDDKLTTVPEASGSGKGGWNPGKTYYKGYCYITSLTQNSPANDWATYSIELQGHGSLEKIGEGNVFDASDTFATASLNTSASKPVATATAK